jgi:ubiquinone/menaquinone biosynthesis C-methylase UbiE
MSDRTLTDEVRSTYDTVAADYAARFRGTEPEQAVDLAMIDHFVSLLGADGNDVLDAGCGTGRMSRYLIDKGCRVRGVDLSPGMIAMAQRDHADIPTQVASITDLPFPDASFDAALYWYSIIHIADSDLAAVFREARRVLRPRGVVLVGFQAGEATHDIGASYRSLGYDVRLTRFDRTADQVAAVLQAAQFSEEARLVRRPVTEKTDQAVLIARATPASSSTRTTL